MRNSRLTSIHTNLAHRRRARRRSAPRSLAVVAVSLVTVVSAAACGGGSSSNSGSGSSSPSASSTGSKNFTLTFGSVRPTASAFQIWVAVSRGYFTQHHINFVFKKQSNALTVLEGVGKSYDMAASFPPQEILGATKGLDITVVSGASYNSANHPLTGIVVPAGSNIKSAADLVGKTVGCVGLTDALYEGFSYWLHQHGINPAQVKGVAVPSVAQQAELSAHKIDAAVATYPYITQMQNAGMKVIADPMNSVGPKVEAVDLVASTGFAKAHPQVLANLRAALQEAQTWMAQNPSKIAPIMEKWTGQSAKAVQQTVKDLPGYSTAFTQTQFNEWIKVLKTVVPNFSTTVTYKQLGAGMNE